MRKLEVWMEQNGSQIRVGNIEGNSSEDACFSYAGSYLEYEKTKPVSISLPLQEKRFSPDRTRHFFEGLLPEGFTRKCVAGKLHADENDYLTILSDLGRECLGAICIVEEDVLPPASDYRKLSVKEVQDLAREGASKAADLVVKSHLSLTGASGKVGLYYDETKHQWYQPIGNAPGTHIVKQSHIRLEEIVVNEQLCMLTAAYLGFETPESFVINTDSGRDGEILFATKRFDRIFKPDSHKIHGLSVPCRLHQEDFSQALGIPASQKYEHENAGYLQKMFTLIRTHCSNPIIDQSRLWDLCVFNFLIGNADNHIKNHSLLYQPDLTSVRLAPAYDIVSTAVYESSTREVSLGIGGRYEIDAIDRACFELEAKKDSLGTAMAMRRFDAMADRFEAALSRAAYILKEQGFSGAGLMQERILSSGGYRNL